MVKSSIYEVTKSLWKLLRDMQSKLLRRQHRSSNMLPGVLPEPSFQRNYQSLAEAMSWRGRWKVGVATLCVCGRRLDDARLVSFWHAPASFPTSRRIASASAAAAAAAVGE